MAYPDTDHSHSETDWDRLVASFHAHKDQKNVRHDVAYLCHLENGSSVFLEKMIHVILAYQKAPVEIEDLRK